MPCPRIFSLCLYNRGIIRSPIFCFANCTFSNWRMSRGSSPIGEYTNEKRNLLANVVKTFANLVNVTKTFANLVNVAKTFANLANVSGEVRQFGESLHDIRQLKLNELLTRNDSFYIQLGQTCI